MSRSFLVKDIAQQAGVSVATVDRVLNRRPNVREHMARRVDQAIEALERQRKQVGVVGRKFIVDLVMEAPSRFSSRVRAALETEMAWLRPSIFRARYELNEVWPSEDLVRTLDRIGARGSHGVLLKAPDLPEVADAVSRLVDRGIPVVTVVTDLPSSRRLAYVGLDNRAAGETAAFLLGQWLAPKRHPAVLVSLSSASFRGEEQRETGFREAVARHWPWLAVHEVSEGHGLGNRTVGVVRNALRAHADVLAVYSPGGANAAILDAFALERRRCLCFIGHDLDDDNLKLLRDGRLTVVLDHDLRQDMRRACMLVMGAHGSAGVSPPPGLSKVDILTSFNLPPEALTGR
jgi:LacI family transcriptional regulator